MTALTISSIGTNVIITWQAPKNYGSAIDKYEINILNKASGLYVENQSLCNGSNSAIISALSCTIPMNTLISTYSYNIGQSILAKARAHNSVGWSLMSNDPDTTILAQGVP